MSYEKNQLAVVGLPLIDPSSRGTFGLHRKWLLGGNFPLLVPARIYKHKRGSEVKIKSKLDAQNMRNIFKKEQMAKNASCHNTLCQHLACDT